MKIVACVKYSLDVSEIKVDPSTKEICLEGVPRRLGDIDKTVLEEGARLKERHGGSLHLLSLGPPDIRNSLREAMAMGVDDALIIQAPADEVLDTDITTEILARAIERLGAVDLIICGEASDDGYHFQIGPRMAERLGLPQVTYARNLTIIEKGILRAERHLEEGVEVVEASLPVLVTVTEESNKPRLPTLLEVLKGKNKKVVLWEMEKDLVMPKEKIEKFPVLQEVATEGVLVQRKQIIIKGKSPAEASKQLIDHLLEEKVIATGGER